MLVARAHDARRVAVVGHLVADLGMIELRDAGLALCLREQIRPVESVEPDAAVGEQPFLRVASPRSGHPSIRPMTAATTSALASLAA
jgi:hypothetical protein